MIRGGRDGYRLAGEPEVGVDLDAAARYCEHAELGLPAVAAAALAAAWPGCLSSCVRCCAA